MKKFHKKVLDGIWSKAVRTRDGFRCQRCPPHKQRIFDEKSKGLHAHHILTKGGHGFSTRWDIENGVAVCYGCHMYLQGNPLENERFAVENLGINYEEMQRKGKTTVKVFYDEKKAELLEEFADIMIGKEIAKGVE